MILLSEFHNGSGTKNRFQQLWMYKTFKHRKHPCIPCLGETQVKLQWYNIYLHFFPFSDFATQLFSTPVTSSNLHNQAPLFAELRRFQATLRSYESTISQLNSSCFSSWTLMLRLLCRRDVASALHCERDVRWG